MGYTAQQYDASFLITDQAGAEKALSAAGFGDEACLEDMFEDLGWSWSPQIDGDDLEQSEGKVSSACDEFFKAIAPYVKDGSYISMIGEDNAIWRWYFFKDKCHYQDGTLAFNTTNALEKKDA